VYAVGYTQLFSLVTWTSSGLMGAAAAVAGQNLGAGRPDRSERGVQTAAMIGVGAAGAIGVLFLTAPGALLAVFGMEDEPITALGRQLLAYLAVSGLFVTVALTFTGGLQGTGDTRGPLYISLASQVLVPVGFCFLLQAMRPLQAPDIWLAIVTGHVTRAVLSVWRFKLGGWKRIQIWTRPPERPAAATGLAEALDPALGSVATRADD
jgi:Na+-driven multidrug efflux pump